VRVKRQHASASKRLAQLKDIALHVDNVALGAVYARDWREGDAATFRVWLECLHERINTLEGRAIRDEQESFVLPLWRTAAVWPAPGARCHRKLEQPRPSRVRRIAAQAACLLI
jgi:hypothetical protein